MKDGQIIYADSDGIQDNGVGVFGWWWKKKGQCGGLGCHVVWMGLTEENKMTKALLKFQQNYNSEVFFQGKGEMMNIE